MYIPAPVLKTLKTPEALQFEQTRRILKQAVSEARQAVTNCSKPFKHHHVLTPKLQRDYELYTQGLNPLKGCPSLPNFTTNLTALKPELARRYALTLKYHADRAEHPAKLEALRQAEADARQSYIAHLSTTPSDLE